MFVASEEATSGSVMANDDRISPDSSRASHRSRCSPVPNIAKTSMLPVSGAEQFIAGGPRARLRPVISANGAYCRLVRPASYSPGKNSFHKPRSLASARSFCRTGAVDQAHRFGSDVRRIHRQQLLDILSHFGVEPEHRRNLGEHFVVGAIQRPSVMSRPHRLPRSEIGRQVPPRAAGAEPPGDPFQDQPMVTEPVAPLAHIRRHHRFDSRPELVRNHTHPRDRPILAGQDANIWETRPSPPCCAATRIAKADKMFSYDIDPIIPVRHP